MRQTYKTVNHSQNFVAPNTVAHMYRLELLISPIILFSYSHKTSLLFPLISSTLFPCIVNRTRETGLLFEQVSDNFTHKPSRHTISYTFCSSNYKLGYRNGVKMKGDKIGMNYIHGVYSTIGDSVYSTIGEDCEPDN